MTDSGCAKRVAASFRDPAGYLFTRDGVLYRQVNSVYRENFRVLMQDLYSRLVSERLLIPHEEVDVSPSGDEGAIVLRPEPIEYVSYPYEWSFSQLKDAAILTLAIQEISLECGLSLRDASAYNVQFRGAEAIFIDTLSFEPLEEVKPWVAYRQFCQHFLAPLALMSYVDPLTRNLLKSFIDGVPLRLASRMLPKRTYLNYSLLAHIHLHASSQSRHQDVGAVGGTKEGRRLSLTMHQALVASLRRAVSRLELREKKTEWGDYYEATNYSDGGMTAKEELVDHFLTKYASDSRRIHDLGANVGRFSQIAARHADVVIAHDIDELAVDRHYRKLKQTCENILPLILDVTNPTPSIGWRLRERDSFVDRCDDDLVMALAVIHHIVIGNNVPLESAAAFFSDIASKLIIEFVPKEDSQVQRLLATREDIFKDYSADKFEQAFSSYFRIVETSAIRDTERSLYIMERLNS